MSSAQEQLTVAVLVGGQSRRMGRDKSFLPLQGQTIVERVVERVSGLSHHVILITNRPADYASLGLLMYADVVAGKGSLGAVHSALYHAPTEHTLRVACDMPFLNPDLLGHLVALRAGYDIVAPRLGGEGGLRDTLHTVYRKTCLPPMLEYVRHDRLSMYEF